MNEMCIYWLGAARLLNIGLGCGHVDDVEQDLGSIGERIGSCKGPHLFLIFGFHSVIGILRHRVHHQSQATVGHMGKMTKIRCERLPLRNVKVFGVNKVGGK